MYMCTHSTCMSGWYEKSYVISWRKYNTTNIVAKYKRKISYKSCCIVERKKKKNVGDCYAREANIRIEIPSIYHPPKPKTQDHYITIFVCITHSDISRQCITATILRLYYKKSNVKWKLFSLYVTQGIKDTVMGYKIYFSIFFLSLWNDFFLVYQHWMQYPHSWFKVVSDLK